jgi:K+ transporter
MSSALTKVPDGAWFTLTLAGVLACVLILWRFGKEQQWAAEAEDRFPTTHLVEKDSEGWVKLTPRYGGDPLSVVKGFAIFFDKAGETTPAVFTQFLSKLVAAPEVNISIVIQWLGTVLTRSSDHGVFPSPSSRDTFSPPRHPVYSDSSRHSELLSSSSQIWVRISLLHLPIT